MAEDRAGPRLECAWRQHGSIALRHGPAARRPAIANEQAERGPLRLRPSPARPGKARQCEWHGAARVSSGRSSSGPGGSQKAQHRLARIRSPRLRRRLADTPMTRHGLAGVRPGVGSDVPVDEDDVTAVTAPRRGAQSGAAPQRTHARRGGDPIRGPVGRCLAARFGDRLERHGNKRAGGPSGPGPRRSRTPSRPRSVPRAAPGNEGHRASGGQALWPGLMARPHHLAESGRSSAALRLSRLTHFPDRTHR